MIVLEIAAAAVGAWLVWKSLSIGLRVIGWALIAAAVINIDTGHAPLGSTLIVATLGAAALLVGHVVFFARRGYWKPRLVQRFTHTDRHAWSVGQHHNPQPPAAHPHRR